MGKRNMKHQRASFLLDNARTRVMNMGSMSLTDAKELGTRCLRNKDTALHLYTANDGDGPGITSIYKNNVHGTTIDQAKLKAMKQLLGEARKHFKQVWLWLYPDDSSGVTGAPLDRQVKYIQDVVKHLVPLSDGVCAGLELDEYTTTSSDRYNIPGLDAGLVSALRSWTDKPVGVHYSSLKYLPRAVATGADVLFAQYRFGHSAQEIEQMTNDAITDLAGRMHFVAWEYHKSSDTPAARALGQAAMKNPKCKGTGNGR